jgi:uncharacterized protein with HEPN domain
MPSERPRQRWKDIIENCARIRRYSDGINEAEYLDDTMVQDAVERCFERIAEAARKLGDGFDADYPDADLPALRRFGSVLRHDYDAINPTAMWRFIKVRLAILEAAAEEGLKGM